MRLEQRPPFPTASYVLPDLKVVYISVPKAACTSLKWLVAGLAGEDPEQFHRSLSSEVTREMTIHRRGLWKHTPMLTELTDQQLDAIDGHGDWFVFAVVRQPAARLWSAWQSKFLLREPLWLERFGSQPWLQTIPSTSDEVVESFHGFVDALTAGAHVGDDRHFRNQAKLVRPDTMPYTRIYPTDEISDLLRNLDEHVRAQGYDGPALTLTRANETPLPLIGAVYPEPILNAVEEFYAADYDTFDLKRGMPRGALDRDTYTEQELADVQRLVERAERIGDILRSARARITEARHRSALRPPPAPPKPPPSALTRLRRRVYRLRRRIGLA